MDVLKLREYEGLSPFEIKDFLAKAASKTASLVGGQLPERRSRQSQLDRHRAARGVLPARPIRHHREQACARLAAGRGRDASGARHRLAPVCLARQARGHARRRVPRCTRAVGGAEVRLRRGQVRARAGRLDHRRQLPGAGPDAGAQRADRARVPAVGDVRPAAAQGPVQALRRRGWHSGHVLHLQVDEDQPAAERRRHHRARHADLHALPRDAAPRGLRPQDRQRPGEAGEPLAVRRRGVEEAARPGGQGVLPREPRQSERRGPERQDHREDRRDPEEAARPDPAHGRRLRHVRARVPLAARRLPAQHDRRLFLQQVLRLHRLAPRRDRGARGQPVRQADRAAPGADPQEARQALQRDHARAAQAALHRPHRRRQPRRGAEPHRGPVAAAAGDDDAVLALRADGREEELPEGLHRHRQEARRGDARGARHRAPAERAVRLLLRPDRPRVLGAQVRRGGRRDLDEGERPPAGLRLPAGRGPRHRAAERQRVRGAELVGARVVREPERPRL